METSSIEELVPLFVQVGDGLAQLAPRESLLGTVPDVERLDESPRLAVTGLAYLRERLRSRRSSAVSPRQSASGRLRHVDTRLSSSESAICASRAGSRYRQQVHNLSCALPI